MVSNFGYVASSYDSLPSGDVVLGTPPPYLSHPWLGAGLPLIATLLAEHGVTARIARFLPNPYDVPEPMAQWAHDLQWTHPSLEERETWVRQFAQDEKALFDQLLARLLAGGERVFGLSIWRTNVDVTLELARQLRLAKPDALIILGGPEASESPLDVRRDWVDAVVSGAAEGVVGPVMRAFVDGQPAEAGVYENVWVHPRHGRPRSLIRTKAKAPPIPRIDYTRIVPMLVDDPDPIIPVLLNLGCPYRCTFCVNTNVYPELAFGENQRLVDELVEIMATWRAAFPEGEARPVRVLICDAAANAFPEQFDDLCQRILDADMPLRPDKINAMVIMDKRFTRERARKLVAAGFDLFFGLESAAPRIRKAMKKPGTIEAVREGCLACAAEGLQVAPGVIVGWPDETEEEYYQTVEFLDWMVSLGNVEGINVTPLRRSDKMMGEDLLRDVEGPPSGLTWVGTGAAGSPAIRARRFLGVFEHFRGIATVSSSAPPSTVIRTMLPGHPVSFWEKWKKLQDRDGDVNILQEVRAPGPPPEVVVKPKPRPALPQPPSEFVLSVERSLSPHLGAGTTPNWSLEAVHPVHDDAKAAVLQFVSPGGKWRVGLRVTPRDDSHQVFCRTANYNVSYLERFQGTNYATDQSAIEALVTRVARAERAMQAEHP